jgi:hypothetical protein
MKYSWKDLFKVSEPNVTEQFISKLLSLTMTHLYRNMSETRLYIYRLIDIVLLVCKIKTEQVCEIETFRIYVQVAFGINSGGLSTILTERSRKYLPFNDVLVTSSRAQLPSSKFLSNRHFS